MAILGPWLNAQVIINSVDLSNRVESVTLELASADVDVTTFGQTGKVRMGGLQDNKLTISFLQDFAAAEVDATISAMFNTTVPFNIKPVNGATSSTNPAYTGTVLVNDYKPMDGKIGDALKSAVTWPVSGAYTRATS